MKFKTASVLLFLGLTFSPINLLLAMQQSCTKTITGEVKCFSPGKVVMTTAFGKIVCSPGHCVTNNTGYLKCSSIVGGGAMLNNLGYAVCSGECVSPSSFYCEN